MPSSAIRTGILAPAVLAAFSWATLIAATTQSVRGTAPYRDEQITPPNRVDGRPLEGTYWKAIELLGTPTPAQDPKREAHLEFQPAGRVSGSDGCNRITGSYQLKGEAVAFSEIAGTQMACIDTGNVERAFHDALKTATRLTRAGERMTLSDAAGTRVAVFTAGAQASPPSTSRGLEGTSWQLVKFQGSDDTTLTPDDRAKYTIEFGSGGQLTARIDCNRGRGHVDVVRIESASARAACAHACELSARVPA